MVVIIENVQAFSIVNFHIFYAVSAIVNVFPCGMGLKDVIVKLPVSKHSVAWWTTKVLWLQVLFLEMPSHVVTTLDNFATQETHVAISTLLHLSLHHCPELIWKIPEIVSQRGINAVRKGVFKLEPQNHICNAHSQCLSMSYGSALCAGKILG